MSARHLLTVSAALVLMTAVTAGCARYDYLARTDRISYHAGDAVKANLERQTIDPSNGLMYDTTGLGKNGSVIPAEGAGSADLSSPSGSPTPAP